jgi:hypothetical protein
MSGGEKGSSSPTIEVSKPKPKVVPQPPPLPIPPTSKPPGAPLSVVEVANEPEIMLRKIEAEVGTMEPREPRGRELRSLGDFQTYEAIRGKLYEIWRDLDFLGEVEVVKRATAAPRLYGDRALTSQSEYEGRVEATGDGFRSYDLYAAMREVALRSSTSS